MNHNEMGNMRRRAGVFYLLWGSTRIQHCRCPGTSWTRSRTNPGYRSKGENTKREKGTIKIKCGQMRSSEQKKTHLVVSVVSGDSRVLLEHSTRPDDHAVGQHAAARDHSTGADHDVVADHRLVDRDVALNHSACGAKTNVHNQLDNAEKERTKSKAAHP